MRYLDLYKKRVGLKGHSFKEVAKNEMNDTINAEFESILGHAEGFLNFKDPFDVVLQTTTNPLTRTAILRPETLLKSGDYLTLEESVWIVKGVNPTRPSATAELFLCNQTFRLSGVEESIYCYCNNSTFGTKGFVDNGHFGELDSKTRLYVQRNEATSQLKIGHRLMFMSEYLFKIIEINDFVYPGLYIITCDIESALNMDDFENNLAYNEVLTPSIQPEAPEVTPLLTLEGPSELRKGSVTRYHVNSNQPGEWALDDESMGKLIAISDNEVEFVAGKNVGWVELSYTMRQQQAPFEVLRVALDIMIY